MVNKAKITAEPGKQELFIEREFYAPREDVFNAFTDPELLKQWWGSGVEVDKLDARSGGGFRFVSENNGYKMALRGVYHEVTKPSQIIETYEFEGSGHVMLQTSKFEELHDKRTKLQIQQVHQSVEDRDNIKRGAEMGMDESYTRLDELLEKMQNSDTK